MLCCRHILCHVVDTEYVEVVARCDVEHRVCDVVDTEYVEVVARCDFVDTYYVML